MTLQILEFIAFHESGAKLRHRTNLARAVAIAAELRAEGGWRITWLPAETPPALAGPTKAERREQRRQLAELGVAA